MIRYTLLVGVLGVGLGLGCNAGAAAPTITQTIPWAGKGIWLKTDTHVHTVFSDGGNTVEKVVARAEANGVDVIAITDHLDHNLKGATPEYFAALDAARKAHPHMVIITGAEWNLPPWGGEEHSVILVPPGAETELTEFKSRFDDLDRKTHDAALALEGLRWLDVHATRTGVKPVVTYEHPSRPDAKSLENVADVKAWRGANDLVAVLAGAPGHQGKTPIGSYKYKEQTIDRWDPVAARVGDAWDTLLGSGINIWAAYAPSDFHNDDPSDLGDRWPGEFSETWLYAPDRTAIGALRALRAGSFFGSHGHIVEEAQLEVSAAGGARPATAGEVLHVAPKTSVRATLRFKVPSRAANGQPAHIDLAELIGVERSGARVLISQAPTGSALVQSVTVPVGGIVLRARGYQIGSDGSRLAFYTNPVRVTADQ